MCLDKKKLWRYTGCAGSGGLVIADTWEDAIEKLRKKFGADVISGATVWQWVRDDYYDAENPDVLDIYDC